jgi:hypothetical protein
MPKKPRSQQERNKNKKGCKDKKCSQRHYEKLISRYQGYLEEIKAGNTTPGRKRKAADVPPTPATVVCKPTDAEKRVVVKFFYQRRGCPPEEDWSGYGGTIALIRDDIGEGRGRAVQGVSVQHLAQASRR